MPRSKSSRPTTTRASSARSTAATGGAVGRPDRRKPKDSRSVPSRPLARRAAKISRRRRPSSSRASTSRRMEEDKAEPLIDRAVALAEESGSIVARAAAAGAKGELLRVQGDLRAGRRVVREGARALSRGGERSRDRVDVATVRTSRLGDGPTAKRREKLLRESIRVLAPLQDRGTLCESQRLLAQLLLGEGRIDEAEKYRARRARDSQCRRHHLARDDARRPRAGPCGAGSRRGGRSVVPGGGRHPRATASTAASTSTCFRLTPSSCVRANAKPMRPSSKCGSPSAFRPPRRAPRGSPGSILRRATR